MCLGWPDSFYFLCARAGVYVCVWERKLQPQLQHSIIFIKIPMGNVLIWSFISGDMMNGNQ